MTEYTFENEIKEELHNVTLENDTKVEVEAGETVSEEENLSSDGRLTPLRILESIEIMSNYDLAFAESVMDKVLSIQSNGPVDSAPPAKAQALERIAAGHEETARHKLGILREMYQDVKDKY